jgi:hypothetical protein
MSAAISTPPLNLIPRTDVPVTVGALKNSRLFINGCYAYGV